MSNTSRADKRWRRQRQQKQRQQGREQAPLPNESDFARYQWLGQGRCDEFFNLHHTAAFGGLGDSGVVLPPNSLSVSRAPTTGASVIEAFTHGLSYAEQVFGAGGFGLFGASWGVPYGYMFYSMWKDDPLDFISILLNIFILAMVWFLIRFDTSGYRYSPVMFNRALGKVHVFKDQTPFFSLWPLWGGGKHTIETYDWACVRAQISRFRVFTGTVAQENATLSCIVFKPNSTEGAAQFPQGIISSAVAVQPLLDHWEHIRRFMEFEGPLFQQDEGPYQQPSTQTLLGALCFGQPFIGPGAAEQWRTADLLVVFWQLIAPIFLPVTMLLGLMRWASFHLRSKPRWPAEILASVGGAALKGPALEAWRGLIPERSSAQESWQ